VDAQGGPPERLTTSPLVEGLPAWSPDGERIAFVRFAGTVAEMVGELYVMNADGSGLVQVTDDGARKPYVIWSPDGHGLAYNEVVEQDDETVLITWFLNLETGERRQITDFGAENYSYHPQGGLLVLEATHPQLHNRRWLYVMDLEQETLAPIVTDLDRPWFPEWSPDGDWIVFYAGRMGSGGIWIVRPDGTDKTELVTAPDGVRHPTWSPDGSQIAYTKGRDEDAHIWIATLHWP
jgi:TolB protein